VHLNSCVYRLVAHVPCAVFRARLFLHAVRTVAYLLSCLIFSRSTTASSGFGITFLQPSTSARMHAQYSVVISYAAIVPDQLQSMWKQFYTELPFAFDLSFPRHIDVSCHQDQWRIQDSFNESVLQFIRLMVSRASATYPVLNK
jgi:hypothetical protein